MLFRETFKHMLDVNTDLQRLLEDVLMMVHVRDVAVAEDSIFQILILIGLTLAV